MVSIKWIYIYDHSVFIRQTRLQHSNVDGPGATDHGRRKEKKKKKNKREKRDKAGKYDTGYIRRKARLGQY
jgi:hypothetical protein